MRILVVEDEQALQDQLKDALNQQGFAVDQATDGEEGLFFAREYPIDLAIVDLGLPKLNGLDLIKKVREQDLTFPILILTARDRWQDKVEGLSLGADDYLAKPFQMEELLARTNALLRRSAGLANPVVKKGPIELDTMSQGVTVNGEVLELTAYEYKVLEYLMMNSDKVISKTELTEHIYEQDHDKDSNVLEVFVRRLRKKLDPEGTLQPIDTLRGRGYRISPNL
ncbi:response regulator transcription factor [Pleionea sp. CnH1-48]|uniref:response regulator transcription factor n=1 Tax=Pleionea sp. CnH1-48 TaxID=2954494 RepID=UPI0020983FE1|nr:response regulator transcription factor [Pleionea sp. CnH1-48]MCO7223501.1 response regulator transcription factor [Pleionea sp. CnH1-48]